MSETVGDFLVKRLSEWGVERIFGYPGDGISGILAALNRAGNEPEFVQVRHEEMASLMACAHAKFTGEVGVCLATSGPGAIHLLNGLYDAKMDHMPVVAIVGQQALASLGGDYQQEVDLQSLLKDVANEYVHVLADPSQARHLVDRAFRIAKSERTVTCLIVPYDVQELGAVEEPAHLHGNLHSGIGYSEPRVVPTEEDLGRAAEVLNTGERVAILVGAGAAGAADEVVEVADILGAGVAKALLGMTVVPDDLPYVTGGIGPIGRGPSWDLMTGCDTLLMVGTTMPYTEYHPEEGQARGVQIDIDGRMLGLRYPNEVNLVGDSRETLRALIPHLKRKAERSWREEIEGKVARWWNTVGERATAEANPLNPMRVFRELSEKLPEDSTLTGDSGSVVSWLCQGVKLGRGMMWSVSGGLATMGSGVPYAIAAKLAHPGRPVIALVGDDAMQMNGNAELVTLANLWGRWEDPRLVVLVLNNRDLSFVSWEQRVMSGTPKFRASQDLPDFPYARYAELLGLKGIRVDRPEDVAAAWEERRSRRSVPWSWRPSQTPTCRRCLSRTSGPSRRSPLTPCSRATVPGPARPTPRRSGGRSGGSCPTHSTHLRRSVTEARHRLGVPVEDLFLGPGKLHDSPTRPTTSPAAAEWLRKRGSKTRITQRCHDSGGRLGRRRRVVERTLSWPNRDWCLEVRCERRAGVHRAFLDLGCALICWGYVGRTEVPGVTSEGPEVTAPSV